MSERQPRGIRLRDKERGEQKPALEGTYTIEGYCLNCEWEGEIAVPKGTAVPWGEKLDRLARCECCGCETLERYDAPDEESDEEEVEAAAPVAEPNTVAESLERYRRLLDELPRPQLPIPEPPDGPYTPYVAPTLPEPRPRWTTQQDVTWSSNTTAPGLLGGVLPDHYSDAMAMASATKQGLFTSRTTKTVTKL